MSASSPGPDEAMLAPIERLARLMAGAGEDAGEIFAAGGVSIFDNRAPFVFVGRDAASRWTARFFAGHQGYADLRHEFGPAEDFQHLGERVYFSLPTAWTWRRDGQAFHETGGWAFVLKREAGTWKIESHGWAVTSYAVSK